MDGIYVASVLSGMIGSVSPLLLFEEHAAITYAEISKNGKRIFLFIYIAFLPSLYAVFYFFPKKCFTIS